ncbi:hypothetical protein, partial [Lentimonas sp. CC19]|uniref:hypothetical protein n=1 Tax=Lentimonas sp. CC19 TaxID=2676097 RepID=UPI001A7EDC83
RHSCLSHQSQPLFTRNRQECLYHFRGRDTDILVCPVGVSHYSHVTGRNACITFTGLRRIL